LVVARRGGTEVLPVHHSSPLFLINFDSKSSVLAHNHAVTNSR